MKTENNTTRFYYFDHNRRVYELNGIKKSSPYQEGYYIPIKIISETEKEFICEYGIINKKSMTYIIGKRKEKVYTEQEKNNDVFIEENRHIVCEMVRSVRSADLLRKIQKLLV